MTFGEIVNELVAGKSVRRASWPDDGTYIKVVEERLAIYRPSDKMMHPLYVSLGDLTGTDWILYNQIREVINEQRDTKANMQ